MVNVIPLAAFRCESGVLNASKPRFVNSRITASAKLWPESVAGAPIDTPVLLPPVESAYVIPLSASSINAAGLNTFHLALYNAEASSYAKVSASLSPAPNHSDTVCSPRLRILETISSCWPSVSRRHAIDSSILTRAKFASAICTSLSRRSVSNCLICSDCRLLMTLPVTRMPTPATIVRNPRIRALQSNIVFSSSTVIDEVFDDPFNWLCLIIGVLSLGCAVVAPMIYQRYCNTKRIDKR